MIQAVKATFEDGVFKPDEQPGLSAAAFYAKFSFVAFPSNPFHLAIAIESVEKLFKQ